MIRFLILGANGRIAGVATRLFLERGDVELTLYLRNAQRLKLPTGITNIMVIPYRDAVEVIEASDLNYRILRPAWLNNNDEIAYGTTRRTNPFTNR